MSPTRRSFLSGIGSSFLLTKTGPVQAEPQQPKKKNQIILHTETPIIRSAPCGDGVLYELQGGVFCQITTRFLDQKPVMWMSPQEEWDYYGGENAGPMPDSYAKPYKNVYDEGIT